MKLLARLTRYAQGTAPGEAARDLLPPSLTSQAFTDSETQKKSAPRSRSETAGDETLGRRWSLAGPGYLESQINPNDSDSRIRRRRSRYRWPEL